MPSGISIWTLTCWPGSEVRIGLSPVRLALNFTTSLVSRIFSVTPQSRHTIRTLTSTHDTARPPGPLGDWRSSLIGRVAREKNLAVGAR